MESTEEAMKRIAKKREDSRKPVKKRVLRLSGRPIANPSFLGALGMLQGSAPMPEKK